MGRFELHRFTQSTYQEMKTAFSYSLDDYLVFGGYPASAAFAQDPLRWVQYMNDSVIEATSSRDVIQTESIRNPALMRKLFILGCQYSAREVSYRKLLGQLNDKGNSATIAHYLQLLDSASLLSGIQKYAPNALGTRRSSRPPYPRLMLYDTSLMTALSSSVAELLNNPEERQEQGFAGASGIQSALPFG